MNDLRAVINDFRGAYDDLFALVDQFPVNKTEQPGACGDWSARQVLAHLSGWVTEAQKRFDAYNAEDKGSVHYDWDEFNARSVSDRAHLSWDETASETRNLVAAFEKQAEAVPAARATADGRYREWLVGLADDCHDHTTGLRDFVETT